MKTLLIALLLASSLSHANYELETRTTKLSYSWGQYGQYDLTLRQIGGSYYTDSGFGFRAMVGQSDEQSDKLGFTTKRVKTRDFWVMNINKRFELSDKISVQGGVNYTEYKSCVNGRCNPDTSLGYGVAIEYKLSTSHGLKISYDDYYKKDNGYTVESTDGLGLSLVARF